TPKPKGSPTPSPSPTIHPSPTPMPTMTPGPIAQTHVLTMQDASGIDSPTYSWGQMAQYVSWSVVGPADDAPAQAAGIKTILYTDPNRVYEGMPEYSNDETEYAHDCSNNRITINDTKQTTYLTEPTSSTLLGLWQQHVAFYNQIGNAQYNMVFEDTPLVHNVSAQPCGYLQPSWLANQNTMGTALNYPIIFNGLGNLANGPDQMSPAMALLPSSIGGEMEGCYSNYAGDPMPNLQVWHTFENTEIQVLASGKLFVCRGFDNTPDVSAQVQRLYMYGSFLLTYDPARAVISPKFTPANSGFWIQPENQFVALDPVVMQPSSVDQLNEGTNVYGRQYRNCYYAGQWIGACASIVNSDRPNLSHPLPWTGVYHHTLVLSGGDILDGGTATTNGPAPPSDIQGSSSIIVIQ
ncbi:MAG TPA: hypothetical protein VII69_02050, partial [Candidatus Eremiobacteraceae bacterium]